MSNAFQFLGGISTTASQSSLTVSTSSQTVLASNLNRKGATITSDGAAGYLILGTTASSTSYTVKFQDQTYYEVPFGWTGAIAFIGTAAAGSLRVTELT